MRKNNSNKLVALILTIICLVIGLTFVYFMFTTQFSGGGLLLALLFLGSAVFQFSKFRASTSSAQDYEDEF